MERACACETADQGDTQHYKIPVKSHPCNSSLGFLNPRLSQLCHSLSRIAHCVISSISCQSNWKRLSRIERCL